MDIQLRFSSLVMPGTKFMHSTDGVVGSQNGIFQLVDVFVFALAGL